MRSITTRLILLISSLLITAIIGIQVYWLKKTYLFEKHEFSTSVLKTIRGVYEDLPLLYNINSPLDSLVERNSESSFMFAVDSIPPFDSLARAVRNELEDFHVFTDCRLAVYKARDGGYVHQDYISADASSRNEDSLSSLPLYQRDFNYVHLYFPNRQQYIFREMRNWIYSSTVLLMLLVGFSLAIYFLVKQKFLVEVQKDFINNITHEFSTPLSVIDLAVEGLEKPAAESNPEKRTRYISSIKYQAAYLSNHIRNLVNSVVVGRYHPGFKKTNVDVNGLLKRTILQLEPLLVRKQGDVIWQLAEGDTTVKADEENLYLVFFNVINNAIKYSAIPKVEIGSVLSGGKIRVTVKDNGPGIEPSQQRKIFRKFYRARDLSHEKGLGLGLYFSKKVIDAHGGSIHVQSEPARGTTFTIEIPLNHR